MSKDDHRLDGLTYAEQAAQNISRFMRHVHASMPTVEDFAKAWPKRRNVEVRGRNQLHQALESIAVQERVDAMFREFIMNGEIKMPEDLKQKYLKQEAGEAIAANEDYQNWPKEALEQIATMSTQIDTLAKLLERSEMAKAELQQELDIANQTIGRFVVGQLDNIGKMILENS